MRYYGRVHNGVVVVDAPAPLPEGAMVRIEVLPDRAQPSQENTTLNERLSEVIGAVRGLPPDASQNIDHYLYGAKRS